MDIDLLSKMVKELILDHDKVALPGVGSFVAEMLPASFSDKGYTINPPYRRLGFRQHLEEDDLLARLYAGSNGISVEDAEKILRDFLAEMKKLLFIKKVIVFPELGRLRATKENSIFFVADESLDIFPEGIGLDPLSLKNHNASAVTSKIVELADTISKSDDTTSKSDDLTPEIAEMPAETKDEAAATAEETAAEPVEANEIHTETADEATATAEETAAETATEEAPSATSVTPAEAEETTEAEPAEAAQPAEATRQELTAEQDTHSNTGKGKAGKRRKGMLVAGIIILSLLILLLLCAMLFFIGMTWYPDLLDHLLYSKEELEIIHYWN